MKHEQDIKEMLNKSHLKFLVFCHKTNSVSQSYPDTSEPWWQTTAHLLVLNQVLQLHTVLQEMKRFMIQLNDSNFYRSLVNHLRKYRLIGLRCHRVVLVIRTLKRFVMSVVVVLPAEHSLPTAVTQLTRCLTCKLGPLCLPFKSTCDKIF